MLSYKDRTYCAASTCDKFSSCPEAFTLQVQEDAEAYGLPISLVDKLLCYENKQQEVKKENGK